MYSPIPRSVKSSPGCEQRVKDMRPTMGLAWLSGAHACCDGKPVATLAQDLVACDTRSTATLVRQRRKWGQYIRCCYQGQDSNIADIFVRETGEESIFSPVSVFSPIF